MTRERQLENALRELIALQDIARDTQADKLLAALPIERVCLAWDEARKLIR